MSQKGRLVLAGIGAAGIGAYVLWQRCFGRAEQQEAAMREDEEDNCAICLEVPQFACRTQCGHRFCTRCFLSWARKQPGYSATGVRPGLARCPLCTASVTRLRALFSVHEGPRQFREVVVYNRSSWMHRWWGVLLLGTKFASSACRLSLLTAYSAGLVLWDYARDVLKPTLVQLPVPCDAKYRLVSGFLCSAIFFGRQNNPGNHAWRLLVHGVADKVLLALSRLGEVRHACLELDELSLLDAPYRLRLRSLGCMVARLVLRRLQPKLPRALQPCVPVVERLLVLAERVIELGSLVCQLRLEIAGLRGLLGLIAWRRRSGNLRRMTPVETTNVKRWVPFELSIDRLCDLEFLVWNRSSLSVYQVRCSWADALREHRVALRALRVFGGEGYFSRIWAPDLPWAVPDVLALCPKQWKGLKLDQL